MTVIIINQAKVFQFLVLLIFMFYCSGIFCQTKIKIAKKNPTPIVTLKLDDSDEAKEYRIGDDFKSGTTFETTDSPVILETNKNLQKLFKNTTHKITFVKKDDGRINENHKTYKGHTRHEVNNNKSGYTVSGESYKFESITTIFDVEVKGKEVTLIPIEGKVNTFQKIPIKITSSKGKSKIKNKLSMTKFESVAGGDNPLTFKRYPDPYPREFTTEAALYFFIDELKSHEQGGYPDEQLADDNNLIGELYLDLENPSKAIYYFEVALEKYEDIEFSGQELAEVYLNLTEAYDDSLDDEYNNVVKYGNLAIKFLKEENAFNEEDLIYAEEDGDNELIEMIKEDLYFNYWNMGWIYKITNEPDLAKEYDELANNYIKKN